MLDRHNFSQWFAIGMRLLILLVLLPILNKSLRSSDVSIWLILNSALGFAMLVDFGVRPTLSRYINYGISGGMSNFAELSGFNRKEFLAALITISSRFYRSWAIPLSIVFGALIWAYFHIVSLQQLSNPLIIPLVSAVFLMRFICNEMLALLEGFNQLWYVKLIDGFSVLLYVLTGTLTYYYRDLIIVILGLFLAQLFSYLFLRKRVNQLDVDFDLNVDNDVSQAIKRIVMMKAYKTGIGSLLSNGITHLSSLILGARIESTTILNVALVQIRMIGLIRDVASVPFYSKIPALLIDHSGNSNEISRYAIKQSSKVYVLFIAACLGVYFAFPILANLFGLELLKGREFWIFLSLAFLLHRLSSMNVHSLLIATNKVYSYVLDGVGGVAYVSMLFLFLDEYQVNALPHSMFIANLFCISLPSLVLIRYKMTTDFLFYSSIVLLLILSTYLWMVFHL